MSAPLVSIMTRTLGRPCLADAAAAVAAQTYRPLEWVVVDAAGRGLEAPVAGDVPVRVVSSGAPMLRSRAANFGLDRVAGARALILDDDDLLLPHAIAALSNALDASPRAPARRRRRRGRRGAASRWTPFAFEYSEHLIARRNLFPPNAALFDMTLWRDDGARFDEALDWYDDWWLWLQVSERTAFVHVREVTAIYRLALSQSGVWFADAPGADPRIREQRDLVIARTAARRARLRSDARRAQAGRARARVRRTRPRGGGRVGARPRALPLRSGADPRLRGDRARGGRPAGRARRRSRPASR